MNYQDMPMYTSSNATETLLFHQIVFIKQELMGDNALKMILDKVNKQFINSLNSILR